VRSITRLTLAFAAVLLAAGHVRSQPAPPSSAPVTRMQVVNQEPVQKELKVLREQGLRIDQLRAQTGKALRELAKAEGKPQEIRKKIQELHQSADKDLFDILDKEQNKRLDEITLQAMERFNGLYLVLSGPHGLGNALELTDEQRRKITEVNDEHRKQAADIYAASFQGGDREALEKKLDEARKAANDKISKLLNEKQLAKLKELRGPEFKGFKGRPQ
jgi:Spy/CpxP family protein refolding chaperone